MLTLLCAQLMKNRHLAGCLWTWLQDFAMYMARNCRSLPSLADSIVWLGYRDWNSLVRPRPLTLSPSVC